MTLPPDHKQHGQIGSDQFGNDQSASDESMRDQLSEIYSQAEYRILAQPSFSVAIGCVSIPLHTLHKQCKVSCSAIITACNPLGQKVPKAQNKRAQQALRKDLLAVGFETIDTEGRDPNANWPVEPGYLIMDCSESQAVVIGIKFHQNAVVVIGENSVPTLVWCQ